MSKIKRIFSKLIGKLFRHGDSNPPEDVSDASENDGVGPDVLHESCVDPSTGVDIIFIHGLGGSRVETWSTGGCFWIKDFLSVDLKDVRIITWGYDANIANAFPPASSESIYGHAETLLNDLCRIRPSIVRPP